MASNHEEGRQFVRLTCEVRSSYLGAESKAIQKLKPEERFIALFDYQADLRDKLSTAASPPCGTVVRGD